MRSTIHYICIQYIYTQKSNKGMKKYTYMHICNKGMEYIHIIKKLKKKKTLLNNFNLSSTETIGPSPPRGFACSTCVICKDEVWYANLR